ncbi:nicotinamide N-methyltransferase isoform X2 [Eurytemora carolleeae]|uniref:nicotinamide N-methyltransferase isoform X2 n=1 Tax=Eurytemora carolleeae TaxID=1294199 RepID=UPI000C793A2A|nr:nicotinamide N-methyltransferase isoform X2 [Eurytemora carolleeae]|eukprot:XP_023340116.1 nicotinamide N-methyltransferase-like isoform X2 [Eurytemora affinis]
MSDKVSTMEDTKNEDKKPIGPEELRKMHQTLSDFYPVAYLNAWAQGVREEWAEFLDRVFSSYIPEYLLQEFPDNGGGPTILDLGCGPSICNIISASRVSKRIYLADLLEGNRRELKKWLNSEDGCWNWDPYFSFQGVLELNPNVTEIEDRVRKNIKSVLPCDLSTSQVWDVVAVNTEQLETVINRSLNWLKEGGLLIVQGSLHEERYTVGSAMFPVLNIDKETLFNVFEKCGLKVVLWETRTKGSTHYFTILKRK